MNFPTFEYAGFLAVVVALNWALPRRLRPLLLLLASWAFYLTWSVTATLILVAVSMITWAAGLVIAPRPGRDRLVLTIVATLLVLSALAVFKLTSALSVDRVGGGPAGRVLVPAGLSFFTLHAVSYLVDVHRRTIPPRRSPIDVAAYVSFFPHLLAGPVLRARSFIPSMHRTPRRPDLVRWAEGAELCLVGVFKKVAIADPLLAIVFRSFDDPSLGGPHLVFLLATLLVAGYADVTGYIDIARGSAKFLGIDLPRNSLYPLTASSSYAEFWRRWQLTLMMWFRDYVYRPIRGVGRRRWELTALFVTFLTLGLWHGLSPGWILWGVASGLIVTTERVLQQRRAARRRAQTARAQRSRRRSLLPRPPNHAMRAAIALGLVALTFPLAVGEDLPTILRLYGAAGRLGTTGPTVDALVLAFLAVPAVLALDRREFRREARVGERDPAGFTRAIAYGVMVTAIVVMAGPDARTFLYQNF